METGFHSYSILVLLLGQIPCFPFCVQFIITYSIINKTLYTNRGMEKSTEKKK